MILTIALGILLAFGIVIVAALALLFVLGAVGKAALERELTHLDFEE
jgi:hypothetical protein